MNTDGTGFHTCKECHKTESLWNHTTTDHKKGEQLEDWRSIRESSCNCGDGTDQRVQSLMFVTMMKSVYYVACLCKLLWIIMCTSLYVICCRVTWWICHCSSWAVRTWCQLPLLFRASCPRFCGHELRVSRCLLLRFCRSGGHDSCVPVAHSNYISG